MKPVSPIFLPLIFLCLFSVACHTGRKVKASRLAMRNTFFKAAYNGMDGMDGSDGANRLAIVLFHMAKRGGNGKRGRNAANLQVKLSAMSSGDSVILALSITPQGGDGTDVYYVNPRHGKIAIFAEGGHGGNGGKGEDGEETTIKRPYGGQGGSGGRGGKGAAGATINVMVDSSALSYANCPCIVYFNGGGRGGSGGMGGRGTGNNPDGASGADGLPGISGPPVYIKSPGGKIIGIVSQK